MAITTVRLAPKSTEMDNSQVEKRKSRRLWHSSAIGKIPSQITLTENHKRWKNKRFLESSSRLTALEACYRLALSEEQKENKTGMK